jgi:prephenate dehydrogenase
MEHRQSPRGSHNVDLTRPDALARLRDIGTRGGRVTRFDGDIAHAEVPGLG